MSTKLFDDISAKLCEAAAAHDWLAVTKKDLNDWRILAADMAAKISGTAHRAKDMEVKASQLQDLAEQRGSSLRELQKTYNGEVAVLRKERSKYQAGMELAQSEHANAVRQRNELEQVVQQRNGEIARLQKERDDMCKQRDGMASLVDHRNRRIDALLKERDELAKERDSAEDALMNSNKELGYARRMLRESTGAVVYVGAGDAGANAVAQPAYGSSAAVQQQLTQQINREKAQEAIDRALADGTWLKSPELIHYVLNEAAAK